MKNSEGFATVSVCIYAVSYTYSSSCRQVTYILLYTFVEKSKFIWWHLIITVALTHKIIALICRLVDLSYTLGDFHLTIPYSSQQKANNILTFVGSHVCNTTHAFSSLCITLINNFVSGQKQLFVSWFQYTTYAFKQHMKLEYSY